MAPAFACRSVPCAPLVTPRNCRSRELDAEGYCIIGTSTEVRYALNRLFRYFPPAQAKEQYKHISPEVRARFEKYFKISFD